MTKSLAHIARAQHIQRSLGVKAAAGYLRNRGWKIESTLWILTGSSRG